MRAPGPDSGKLAGPRHGPSVGVERARAVGPGEATMSGSAVTRPMIATGSSQRSHTARTAPSGPARRSRPLRSWDSLIITSNGSSQGSRRGIASRSTSIPVAPRYGGLAGGAGDARGAQVLDPDDQPAGDQLEGRLDQQLLRKRVAHLDRRPLGGFLVPERRGRQHRRAADPVAPVAEPYSTTRLPGPSADARVSIPSSSRPWAITLTSGLPLVRGVEHELAAEVGTPTQLP